MVFSTLTKIISNYLKKKYEIEFIFEKIELIENTSIELFEIFHSVIKTILL